MSPAFDAVAGYRYVSLTTFRRDGRPVSTPVWIAPDGDELVFISEDGTGKTKRLAHTRRVELRECSMRGEVAPDAVVHTGTATVHRDEATLARVRRSVGRKYPEARLSNVFLGLAARVGLVKTPRAAIVIRLDA